MFKMTILMSTYNGERFLREQLDSILGQDCIDWKLVVRDDGSSDSTVGIVKEYAGRDARISLVQDKFGNQGPAKSFIRLLSEVDTPYFMFCDQDDVWLPCKVSDAVSVLDRAEGAHLVFTDLRVVDEHLDLSNSSFMAFSRFDPISGIQLNKLIMQNVVVGCTVAGNQELLRLSKLLGVAPPSNIVMHDWWLALVASVFGEITYLDKKTILYRQHGGNCLGAKKSGFSQYVWMLRTQRPWLKAQKYLNKVTAQAESFYSVYNEQMPQETRNIFERVASVRSGVASYKIISCFIHGMTMHSIDRNVALLLSFACGRSKGGWYSIKDD